MNLPAMNLLAQFRQGKVWARSKAKRWATDDGGDDGDLPLGDGENASLEPPDETNPAADAKVIIHDFTFSSGLFYSRASSPSSW